MVLAAVFAGMRHETEQRVGDFYTQDLRLTPNERGALPSGLFGLDEADAEANGTRALEELRAAGASVSLRYESQYVLSRRGLVEAGLGEDDQFVVDAPGSHGDGDEVIALGSLIGIAGDDRGRSALARHVVSGSLPGPDDAAATVPLVMSVDRVARMLTPAEREAIDWPPSVDDIDHLRFEITAAVLEEGGDDIIRRPAKIVGLYDTDVDILDAFTLVSTLGHVRALNGHDRDAVVGNVIVVDSGPAAARRVAADNGWSAQGSASFTHAYLGQLVEVLQGLSLLLAGSLFLLPAFLVTHGMSRQLASHQREVAVCRALGVPASALRASLARLGGHLVLWAVAMAAAVSALLAFLLHLWLPGRDLAVPADVHIGWLELLPAVVALLAVGGAVALAIRSAGRADISSTLRSL
jgi:hypothetical protein